MIDLHPGTTDQKLTFNIFVHSDLDWTWWKMIDLPLRYCRPEYDLKFFLHSDVAWTGQRWLTSTLVLQTRISPKFLLSDLDWTWWKMIKFTQVLQTRISPNFFKFRFSLDMVKDDWSNIFVPPWYCRAEYHLKYFLISDWAWTWWKMIDPPQVL